MKFRIRIIRLAASLFAAGLIAPFSANADSVYAQLVSASGNIGTFAIVQDFSSLIVGGGVKITLSGPISLYGTGFTPVADASHGNDVYLSDASRIDPAFTGYSPLAVHWGTFAGVTGRWVLGTLQVAIDGPGTGQLIVSNDPLWGGWGLASGANANVTFSPPNPGQDQFTAVPVPATAFLFTSGLGLLGLRRRPRPLTARPASRPATPPLPCTGGRR